LPALAGEAMGIISVTGKPLSSRTLSMVLPTSPVAPATATLMA
jgi:hypothetical protein